MRRLFGVLSVSPAGLGLGELLCLRGPALAESHGGRREVVCFNLYIENV